MAVPSWFKMAVGRRVRARFGAASLILQRSPRWRRREAVAARATPPRPHDTERTAGPRRTNEDAFHEGETFFGVYDGHSGAISASRGAAAPSRRRRASSPGEEVVGGFFFDFEAIHAPRR